MCQSHTGRLTGLWFLPKPAFGLNTNDDDNDDDSELFIAAPSMAALSHRKHASAGHPVTVTALTVFKRMLFFYKQQGEISG